MHGKKTLSQLSPYQQGKQIEEIQREYGLEKIVKLSSNENPFGNSTKVSENLLAHTSTFNVYPDGHATELRSEMAKKLYVNEDVLIFGNGSDELVQIICTSSSEPFPKMSSSSLTCNFFAISDRNSVACPKMSS